MISSTSGMASPFVEPFNASSDIVITSVDLSFFEEKKVR
jgi:hypothetical protein